jgi:hypothetical protein
MLYGSRSPAGPVELPMMSFVNIPAMFFPPALVAAHHVDPVDRVRRRTTQGGDHVGDHGRYRDPGRDRLHVRLELDGHPAAGPQGRLLELPRTRPSPIGQLGIHRAVI